MDREAQYVQVFNKFDKDGDGKISALELQQCAEELGGDLTLEKATAALRLLDKDNDGLMGLDEFEFRGGNAVMDEEVHESMRRVFKVYEMEGNGCITPESLQRVMKERFNKEFNINECKAMVARSGLSKDGVTVTFDAFAEMAMREGTSTRP